MGILWVEVFHCIWLLFYCSAICLCVSWRSSDGWMSTKVLPHLYIDMSSSKRWNWMFLVDFFIDQWQTMYWLRLQWLCDQSTLRLWAKFVINRTQTEIYFPPQNSSHFVLWRLSAESSIDITHVRFFSDPKIPWAVWVQWIKFLVAPMIYNETKRVSFPVVYW